MLVVELLLSAETLDMLDEDESWEEDWALEELFDMMLDWRLSLGRLIT